MKSTPFTASWKVHSTVPSLARTPNTLLSLVGWAVAEFRLATKMVSSPPTSGLVWYALSDQARTWPAIPAWIRSIPWEVRSRVQLVTPRVGATEETRPFWSPPHTAGPPPVVANCTTCQEMLASTLWADARSRLRFDAATVAVQLVESRSEVASTPPWTEMNGTLREGVTEMPGLSRVSVVNAAAVPRWTVEPSDRPSTSQAISTVFNVESRLKVSVVPFVSSPRTWYWVSVPPLADPRRVNRRNELARVTALIPCVFDDSPASSVISPPLTLAPASGGTRPRCAGAADIWITCQATVAAAGVAFEYRDSSRLVVLVSWARIVHWSSRVWEVVVVCSEVRTKLFDSCTALMGTFKIVSLVENACTPRWTDTPPLNSATRSEERRVG